MTTGIHESHIRLDELIRRYGNQAEIAAADETMKMMLETADTGYWAPITELVLPPILVTQAKHAAQARQKRARRFSLQDKHGVTRTMEMEVRSAEAQLAACIMINCPFNHKVTDPEARAHGNLLNDVAAFCANPGNFNLLIHANTPKKRRIMLMLETGIHTYEWAGWCVAGQMMQPQFVREFVRNGVVARPYIVPREYLSSPETW